MCGVCGCGQPEGVTVTNPETGAQVEVRAGGAHDHSHHHHDHPHEHGQHHHHDHSHHDHEHGHHHHHDHENGHKHPEEEARGAASETITLERRILEKNDRLAERNRGWFSGRRILALNLVSSPGSGKTTLLERTVRELGDDVPIHVIEGDQATTSDARRIQAAGARVVQINTGRGCHLEADMVARGLAELDPPGSSLVVIENVGNLVCPALFDLGEAAKVAILSITEGEDKPLKYPHMFRAARLLLVNKLDLLPHLDFDLDLCLARAREVNPGIHIIRVSATRGDGMAEWYAWIRRELAGLSPGPGAV